ncbi:amino acid deaminase/aldolase [Solimonas terrae]|uniref:Amino acid deaminase/aldolase n=1 Tax=Solimonas terrae TaxID=1396819 RepID=A0A6M2BV57_9GAMM|nr:amino acid deaminase/aldolase [Solimonas terrae]NGY06240.1 amino acid deaminase/aldolase [Solimonas terrae]
MNRLPNPDYASLSAALADQSLPAAVLDLDRLEANARAMLTRAGRLPIRLGSKSIRCVEVMKRVLALDPRFRGLLCYSAREAAWLASQGFDDLLVAYPTVVRDDLEAAALATRAGTTLTLMIDDARQIDAAEQVAREHGVCLSLAIDIDMSSAFPGLYFGVRRSPVNKPAQAVLLARRIAASGNALRLRGVMGYEGQIAGLQDDLPKQSLKNRIVRWLKKRSVRELSRRRQAVVDALYVAGFTLEFVNGGGTGSLETTADDRSVTEAAAGSGLYSPTLFDHFSHFRHAPALYFALAVARQPLPNVVTCSGGGYIASGPAGNDRVPQPFLPDGLKLLPLEGAGEVQTPLRLPKGVTLAPGAPVFFRHAKAGELCERFDRILLLRDGKPVGEVPTYRGQGQCFF